MVAATRRGRRFRSPRPRASPPTSPSCRTTPAPEEQQRRARPSLRPTRAHLAALVLLLVLRVHHHTLRERARELTLRPVQRLPAVRDGHPARRGVDAGFLAPAAAEHGAGIPRVRQLDVLRRMRGAPRLSERAVRRASAIHREPKPALLHPRRGHVTAAAREVRAPRDALRGANLRSRRVAFVVEYTKVESDLPQEDPPPSPTRRAC